MSSMDMDGPRPEEYGDDVNFEIVDDRGAQATLECPACGFVFDIDAYTSLNLEWSRPKKALVAICPICQRRQK